MAHLVLPETQANASQNQKSRFFQRTDRQDNNISNTFYLEKRYNKNIKAILAA